MPRFLHIGCGMNRKDRTTAAFNTPEWEEVRLDIDPAVAPDIVGTMTDMSAVPDGGFDAVFSSHNIEHLYPFEVPKALREFRRVLSDDGFAVITCPDLQAVAALVAEGKLLEPAYNSPAGPISPLDIIYGHRSALARGNLFMAHRCGFTLKVLADTLTLAGFAQVAGIRRRRFFDLWVVASKRDRTPAAMQALASVHLPAER